MEKHHFAQAQLPYTQLMCCWLLHHANLTHPAYILEENEEKS